MFETSFRLNQKDKGVNMKSTKQIVRSLIVLLGMAAPPTWGALSELGGEFPLLGNVGGHQQNPQVALSNSNGFVVWQNMAANGRMERVMLQRLGSDMTGVGVAVAVSAAEGRWNELNPRVALLPGGGAVVTWIGGARSATDIYARFVNSNGSFITPDITVNSNRAGNQRDPDVAVSGSGEVIIVWSGPDADAASSDVFGQRFTAQGAKLGGEFVVNTTKSMNQSDPSVAGLKDGGFVVAWISESSNGRTATGAPNLRGNVIGRVFAEGGGTAGTEFQVNSSEGLTSEPNLTATSGGGFTAAWVQRDEANTRNLGDVHVRLFNAQGAPAGDSARHNTYLRGQQDSPQLVQLANDALVVWTSYGQDGSGAGVMGRLMSGGREFQINSQGRYHQRNPAVATDGANKFLAVWVNTINPRHSILSAQRYVTSDGELDGVVDVTAGDVEIVEATTKTRATPSASAAIQSAGNDALRESAVSSLPANVPAPPQPTVAPVPPSPVEVSNVTPSPTPSPAATRPSLTPAAQRTSAPSEAARRSLQPSFAQRSASAGMNTLRSMAMSRTSGNRGFGAQPSRSLADRMSSIPSRSRGMLGQLRPGSRPTPGRSFATPGGSGFNRSSYFARRGGGGSTGSLAQRMTRGTPQGSSARGMMNRARTGPSANTSRRNAPVHAALRGNNLQWSSTRGATFQVQGSNDMNNWRNIGASRSGRGGADQFAIDRGNGPRYYRVIRK